jgi:NodT family efflux transporter outer membrane factor (OMF) lipoprotein
MRWRNSSGRMSPTRWVAPVRVAVLVAVEAGDTEARTLAPTIRRHVESLLGKRRQEQSQSFELLGMVGPEYTRPSAPPTPAYKELGGWKVATPDPAGEQHPGGRPWESVGDILLGLDMSYEVDVWGRVRRTVRAAKNEAQATAADLETARLSLQAELVVDYFELLAADAPQQLLDETVKYYEQALQLTMNRFIGGAAPRSDVAQAQTQLETTRVQATDVGVARAQFEHALATRMGKPPAEFSLPPRPLEHRPPEIPVGVPSQLLERRPDIAAAERRVAEANEQIGIAKAAYYPTVMLNASVGFEGSSFGNVLNASSLLWSVGASITQTIFDAGRRRATSDIARAAYDATVASYRATTLTAFQQVEDNLAVLRILEAEAQPQRHAVAAARDALQLFANRYRGGVDNHLQVITAQTTLLTNQRTEIDILRRRMDAAVLLVKALGGGWDAAALSKAAE